MTIKKLAPDEFDRKYFKSGSYKNYKQIAKIWTGRVAKIIKRMLKAGRPEPRVLDVGCAQGYLLVELQKQGCEVTGLEYSLYAIRHAEKEVAERIKRGSILDAKLSANEFDAVVCLNVLEYIPEEQVLKALKNLVKWTNNLIFFTTCFTHSRYSSQKYSPDRLRITVKTENQWKKLFDKAGARFKTVFYDGGGGDVLVFKKGIDKQ